MSTKRKVDTLLVKEELDDDSDVEIVGATIPQSANTLVDVPDLIDPKTLSQLIEEPAEVLPPVVETIVSKLSNDEEFEKECETFYKENLEIDVDLVQVDVTKVVEQPVETYTPPAKKISLFAGVDDIRTTRDLPGICTLCEESDDHVQLLATHLKEKHQLKHDLYVCPFCDYTSAKSEVVLKHTTKVHKLVSYLQECDQCDYKTFRGDLFNRHTNQHLKEKIYSCTHCNYKTINLELFQKHLSSKHTEISTFNCQQCEFTATSKADLNRHKKYKHSAPEPEIKTRARRSKPLTFVCIHCSFNTNNLADLENHTLEKHPQKEILFCNVCEFSTTENNELIEHGKTHLKIKSEVVDS